LGIVGERSALANLASTEFVARQLQMCSVWIEKHLAATETKKYGFKVINFTLDESRVCQQQAGLSSKPYSSVNFNYLCVIEKRT
jgi:hypothetical protein